MVSRLLAAAHLKLVLAGLSACLMIAANVVIASAHNWGSWHWDKGGSVIVIRSMISGGTDSEAEAARLDAWNKIGILYNYRSSTHTDVSVFDGNFGNTGWSGLASIESSSWDWGCFGFCHITHAHARYNSYYGGSPGYIQGVYCQEVFHTYGFGHSDTGDCMGLGYFPSGTYYYGPHNNADFYNRYRYH